MDDQATSLVINLYAIYLAEVFVLFIRKVTRVPLGA